MLQRKNMIFLFMVSIAILVVSLLPAIPQDMGYHAFADTRSVLGISNFLNVISSLPFLIVGAMGVYRLCVTRDLVIIDTMKPVYGTFFVSIALIGFGSGYYHLHPDNLTLVWDRLAMSLAFMAFFVVVVGEYLDEKVARKIFYPLLLAGPGSVIYWYWTESLGQGDLRLYILVQYLPVLLIPFILWSGDSRFTHGYYYGLVIACYVLAKILEITDDPVFSVLTVISGHSIKHLVSALAAYLFYRALSSRQSAVHTG